MFSFYFHPKTSFSFLAPCKIRIKKQTTRNANCFVNPVCVLKNHFVIFFSISSVLSNSIRFLLSIQPSHFPSVSMQFQDGNKNKKIHHFYPKKRNIHTFTMFPWMEIFFEIFLFFFYNFTSRRTNIDEGLK